MLIGANPRIEAPVLNSRVRKAWLRGAAVAHLGEPVDLTYQHDHVGSDRRALSDLSSFGSDNVGGEPSIVVVGMGALTGDDGEAVLAKAGELARRTDSGLLVLHTAAGRVGAMDVGCTTTGGVAAALDGSDVVYNLGADEIDVPDGAFVIYQGSHGDRGAHRADVILPAAAWTEENGLFVNTEGRPQLAFRASFPPGEAKENWAILRALSAQTGTVLPYDSLAALRRTLVDAHPHLEMIDVVPENEAVSLAQGKLGDGSFASPIEDHYLVNPITRASALMADLSARAKARRSIPLAAE